MELKEYNHDYYCSETNYYSNDFPEVYKTFEEFFGVFGDADEDLNLIFRWDIILDEETKAYSAFIFIIKQRKGIFHPIYIKTLIETDIPKLESLLKKHWAKIQAIWKPISGDVAK